MVLQKGALIFANYSARVKDTGEGIESTTEEGAKKLNIFDSNRKYAPRLIAVGEGWLIKGLDEEVQKMDVGEKKEVELSPEKAFGQRDPTQVRMIPLRKFGEREHELEVGDSVDIDNRVGTIRFIGSGRAQVDFNHRLAGKKIVYDFEVLSKVEGEEGKVKALVERRLTADGQKPGVELQGGMLRVSIPQDLYLLEGLQIIKKGIANDVFKFVPDVREVTFSENFMNEKAPPKKEEKKEETQEVPAPATVTPRPRKRKTSTPGKSS